jgi:hypothetical protein
MKSSLMGVLIGLVTVFGTTLPILSQQIDGDAVIRSPYCDSEIVITTTNRLAGAIHSLTWNGQEFIDSVDHGRQLQSASNFDAGTKFFPETFNPTEAGSRSDGAGDTSSSRLLKFESGKNWLSSTSQMAFWLEPGQRSGGVLAKNSTVISEHLLSKKVRIGIPGFKNVIRYRVAFNTPKQEIHRLAQFEVLTGYMPVKFRKFYGLSTSNGTLSRLSDGPGEQNSPVILSTKNGDFAMGALSVSAPERIQIAGPGYGRFAFDAQKVTKWNVVYRIRDSKAVPTGVFQFEVLVVIGDLETVRSTLFELVRRN